MLFLPAGIAALLAIVSAVASSPTPELDKRGCELSNSMNKVHKVTDTTYCTPQGENMWLFEMIVTETGTGLPDNPGDAPSFGNIGSDSAFVIYDNSCVQHGAYEPGSCGFPQTISESWLPWTVEIQSYFTDVGLPEFKFAYGAGVYEINVNNCGCVDGDASFPSVQKVCACAFPHNGDGST